MTVKILVGDCREILRTLPEKSVQCCVTSPPYFGLRDYKVTGQIGLEPTPAAFVAEMVAVFREVWRVLRNDGTVWLNLGDSFANNPPGARDVVLWPKQGGTVHGPNRPMPKGLKQKDLMMIPARVAIALQDDGWWVRRDVIWNKPNPMPESADDRPTTAHEYVFLLTKSGDRLFWTHRDGAGTRKKPEPDYRWVHRISDEERTTAPDGWPEIGKDMWRRVNLWSGSDYFYDAEAVREERASDEDAREFRGGCYVGGETDNGSLGKRKVVGNKRLGVPPRHGEYKSSDQSGLDDVGRGAGRNLRSVWTIATQPFSQAHFATFPPKLAETCILAGTSEKGACRTCGAPWARTITKGEPDEAHRASCGADASGGYGGQSTKNHDAAGVQNASDVKRRILDGLRKKTYGWQPTCACPPADLVPCVCLDPFGGAGTVGLVADRLQRDAVLIELNPDYVEIMRRRIEGDAGLFAQVAAE